MAAYADKVHAQTCQKALGNWKLCPCTKVGWEAQPFKDRFDGQGPRRMLELKLLHKSEGIREPRKTIARASVRESDDMAQTAHMRTRAVMLIAAALATRPFQQMLNDGTATSVLCSALRIAVAHYTAHVPDSRITPAKLSHKGPDIQCALSRLPTACPHAVRVWLSSSLQQQ